MEKCEFKSKIHKPSRSLSLLMGFYDKKPLGLGLGFLTFISVSAISEQRIMKV